MPQNVQKRLLLYILQQLSLFSAIDLPNLEEVSLNNIHLRDVSIDSKRLGVIHGLRLELGTLKDVELTGGMVDGVNFKVTGVDLVVVPSVNHKPADSQSSTFLLAQSTADLAKTVFVDSNADELGSELLSAAEGPRLAAEAKPSVVPPNADPSKKASPLGGVMSKAVEIALLRLHVSVRDISIAIKVEPVTLVLEIDEIQFDSVSGVRNIVIKGIKLLTTTPGVNKGARRPEVPPETPHKEATVPSSDNSFDESSDNIDSDNADESLMDSMVFTHEEASLIYMSATSQAFPSRIAASPKSDTRDRAIILYIDRTEIAFEGAVPLKDLKINVNSINAAFTPLLPTLTLISTSLTKLIRLKTHEITKMNVTEKSKLFNGISNPEYSDNDSDNDEPKFNLADGNEPSNFFNKLRIGEIVASLTSALNEDGTFSSFDDDLSILLSNCTVKQKLNGLMYGGIELIDCLKYTQGEHQHVFRFLNEEKTTKSDLPSDFGSPSQKSLLKADFRFEIQPHFDDNRGSWLEMTILLSKIGKFDLDSDSIRQIVPFLTALGTASSSFSLLNDNISNMNRVSLRDEKTAVQPNNNVVIIQTSSFQLETRILELLHFEISAFPVSYSSATGELLVHKIAISSTFQGTKRALLVIPQIRFCLKSQEFSKLNLEPLKTKESRFTCSRNLFIGAAFGAIDASLLLSSIHEISKFSSDLKAMIDFSSYSIPMLPEKHLSATTKSVFASAYHSTYQNSNLLKRAPPRAIAMVNDRKNIEMAFNLHFDLFAFSVENVFPHFGNLKIDCKNINAYYLLLGDSVGSFKELAITRVSNELLETLLRKARWHSQKPMVTMKYLVHKKEIDLEFRQFYIEYYAQWLNLFEKDVSKGHDAEKIVSATPKNNSGKYELDVRLTFFDFALGLTPMMLPSKIYVLVGHGTLDFTSDKTQCYAKSSFKDILLHLIDDTSHGRNEKKDSKSMHSSITEDGFVEIGRINACHVGVTIATDMQELQRRNVSLGLSDELPLIDAKLNSDTQNLFLCADSCHTLLQTINNLKEPVKFMDDEKSRVRVAHNFLMPVELRNEITNLFGGHAGHATPKRKETSTIPPKLPSRPVTKKPSEDFLVIDEYYDDTRLLSHDELNLTQLSIEEPQKNTQEGLIQLVEGHFNERLKRGSPVVVPFKLNVNLAKTEVLLFDGYDWKTTRKSLRKAVKTIEKRVDEITAKNIDSRNKQANTDEVFSDHENYEMGDEEVEEVLFKSIHITSKGSENRARFIDSINSQLQDGYKKPRGEPTEENERNYRDLKLSRSHSHKIMVDVKSIELNVTNYTSRDPRFEPTPPNMDAETLNKLDVRIDTIVVYDNVQTSTWNKLLSYMSSMGEREVGTNMVQLEILNIRPDPKLPFAEALVKTKLLPLRLYVDQDTLSFLSRFFEFKDTRFELPMDEVMYFQKLTLEPLQLKFDYKPKKMDFVGLRAGNHAEWANLFTLNGSTLALEKAVIYGAYGFPEIGAQLGQIYGPYIQKCQLAGILSGIGPIKSIINVGKGLQDFVAIPIKEYQNDGNVLYGLQKGTKAFAKTTSYEFLKLGINLASGLQVALETLEEYFGGEGVAGRAANTTKEAKVKKPKKARSSDRGRKPNLMESSQNLRAIATAADHSVDRERRYSMTAIDEDEDLDDGELLPSILIFDPSENPELDAIEDEAIDNSDSDALMDEDKLTSLYSNQPKNAKDGLKLAYKSFGKNLTVAKKKFKSMKNEVRSADTLQDQLKSIAKSSPVLVIRPIIGTTEAMMKTLMGITNGIDSRPMRENKDKYRADSVVER